MHAQSVGACDDARGDPEENARLVSGYEGTRLRLAEGALFRERRPAPAGARVPELRSGEHLDDRLTLQSRNVAAARSPFLSRSNRGHHGVGGRELLTCRLKSICRGTRRWPGFETLWRSTRPNTRARRSTFTARIPFPSARGSSTPTSPAGTGRNVTTSCGGSWSRFPK